MTRIAILCALALLACGKSSSSDKRQATEVVPDRDAAAVEAGGVGVLVDGATVTTLDPGMFAARTEITGVSGLPDSAGWKSLTARAGKRALSLLPRDGYAIRLYQADGAPAIGAFADGAPDRPEQYLVGIEVIEIAVRPQRVAGPMAGLEIRRAAGSAASVDWNAVGEASVIPPDGDPVKGWLVSRLLDGHVGASDAPALVVHGVDDEKVDVPAGILRDPGHVLFVKVNRRGMYRFRWFEGTGKDAPVRGELRGVTGIEIR